MEASVRAIHIATVIRLINSARPLSDTTAPMALKNAIKQAAIDNDTESRRVHRNFVWALDYRGRGAQNRAALDLVNPAATDFRVRVSSALSAFDAAYVIKALNEAGTQSSQKAAPTTIPVVTPTPKNAPASPTATAVWLNEQIGKGLIDHLTNTVIRRYPVEDRDDVAGEVHLRIAHWGAKGSFDEHLALGNAPTVSRMAAWVGNRIKSALGRRGQDALWRQLRGSRTESEYRNEEVHPDSLNPESVYSVALESDGTDDTSVQRVIIDPRTLEDSLPVVQPVVSAETALRMIIRASRPNAAERYLKILEAMIADTNRSAIADQDGCSVGRAGKLTARVRADLKAVPMLFTVSDARKVLRYIVEEPCITYAEIIEDLRMDGEEVDRALRLLMMNEIAYITESNGRSFMATDIGLAAATGEKPEGLVGKLMI